MPFPFLPGGALLAIAVLGGALIVFGVALRAIDHAITASQRSMLPGLVSGFRTWTSERATDADVDPTKPVQAAGSPMDLEIVELVNGRIGDERDRA
jgi:hypothetical protein